MMRVVMFASVLKAFVRRFFQLIHDLLQAVF